MRTRDFLRAGHWPTLLGAFLYFDVSFMVWMLLGALANSIAVDFVLTDSQKGLLVAIPLLGGAMLRIPLGVLADHIGGRRAGALGLALTIVPLVLVWLWVESFSGLLLAGALLGVAGGSFAVALPLASRWYPLEHQGLAMGIAGAGNSGTVLAALFGPRLAEPLGWQGVFGLAAGLIGVTLCAFMLLARDAPGHPPPRRIAQHLGVLRERDTWWLAFFYAVTFGGFVGLASFLGIFFHDQYGLSKVRAGTFTAACVFAGSFLRPVGGFLADRYGGTRLLAVLYAVAAAGVALIAASPPLFTAAATLTTVMGVLGMGNGAVFQLVPQRFSREIGAVTGIVGAAGGLGGFLLPIALGGFRGLTGSFAGGLIVFALIALGSSAAIIQRSRVWESMVANPSR